MTCPYCNRSGLHLCSGLIKAYNDRMTPEEREARCEALKQSLKASMEASEKLRKMGFDTTRLVCSQKN